MSNIVAYLGKKIPTHGDSRRALNDWHGNQIGTTFISSSWRVYSYMGTHMHQIYATINGVEYTGRGWGEGMSVALKPVKNKRSR